MAENATTPIADMDLTGGKPQCGSGQEIGEYDLGLHVAALCTSRGPPYYYEGLATDICVQSWFLRHPSSVLASPFWQRRSSGSGCRRRRSSSANTLVPVC